MDNHILLKMGFFLLLAGFSVFSYHISIIIKKRLKKKLDKPFTFALVAIGLGNILHLAAFILVWTKAITSLAGPFIYCYLFLWVVLSIIGYLYKIVPFLWWTYKYSKEIGKKAVPSLKDMMNEKIVVPLFLFFILSVLVIFVSFVLKVTILFTIGQMILSVVFIVFAVSILSVLKK